MKMRSAEILGAILAHLRAMPSRLWQIEAKAKGIRCHPSVLFLGRPLMSCAGGSEMILSEGVRIHSALRSNPLGCFQPCVLRTMAEGARLELGKNVGISGTVLCAGTSITIGENTIIGSGTIILDNDLHVPAEDGKWGVEYVRNSRSVSIGRRVFIGARAVIMKGVRIGDDVIIGAGSVVTKEIPDGMIAAGNPARIIRQRTDIAS